MSTPNRAPSSAGWLPPVCSVSYGLATTRVYLNTGRLIATGAQIFMPRPSRWLRPTTASTALL
jgi:hypothetical protein